MVIGYPVNESVTVEAVAVNLSDASPNCALVSSSETLAPFMLRLGVFGESYNAYAAGTTLTLLRLAASDAALMTFWSLWTKIAHCASVWGRVTGNGTVGAVVS